MLEGRRLKRLMVRQGLSLSKMGQKMGGVPVTTVHQWTKSEANNAHIETMLRISKALGVCIYRLLPPEVLKMHRGDLETLLDERRPRTKRRRRLQMA
jgi:transcriptional regulator with XRE-family HTH domain